MTKYIVCCPEIGSTADDGLEIIAVDEEDAARRWAQREDVESADYWIVGGDGATVIVRAPDGSDTTMRVTGEPTIIYRARPAPLKDTP